MSASPIVEPITFNVNILSSYTEDERLIANGNTIQTDIHQTCCDIFTFMLCCMCPQPPCSCCCSNQVKSERLAVEKFTVYFDSTYKEEISQLAQKHLKISLKNRKYLLTSDACKLIKYAEENRKINKASQNAVTNSSASTSTNVSSSFGSNSTKSQALTITISPANGNTATIGESSFSITSPISESSLPGSNSPSILPINSSEMIASPTLTPLSSQSPESPPPSRPFSKWPISQSEISQASIDNQANRYLTPTLNQTPNQVLAQMPRSPNPNSGPRVTRTQDSVFHSELNNSLPTISE